MKAIHWPNWGEALASAPLAERQKQSFAITLRWYLSFCRRSRAEATHQSAREFIAWAQACKRPEPWKLESWREAIRWFFRAAATAGSAEAPERARAGTAVPRPAAPIPTAPPGVPSRPVTANRAPTGSSGQAGMPGWKADFLTVVRRRHYSYRTEQSYLVWLERFARFCRTEDLARRGPEDVKAFLDGLALDQRLSASSQRQALNAVVFLLREVFGQELGDFSDYRRARMRPHAPTWLTRGEMEMLLQNLEASGAWALMTRVAFGGGLRLMELLRLRIKVA